MSAGVIKWDIVGDVFIVHTTEGRVPDSDWNAFVQELRTKPVRKFLGASTGSTDVSSTQRKAAAEVMKERNISATVVTDDRLVRGVVTAASWLGANIKSFSWAELNACLRALDASPEQHAQITATLMRLRTLSLTAAGH